MRRNNLLLTQYDVLVVGCGLTGMVVARELAEKGKRVHIVEKRNHIGGNMYDFYDNGILVQKYGPHVFFSDNEFIQEYITRFVSVYPFFPECRTYIGGQAIPMPFNFTSIDIIYSDKKYASELKRALQEEFGYESIVSVVDIIDSKNPMVHEYGMYMYENEYRKYSAKQWGVPIEQIDRSVFLRVPVYISYRKPYLKAKYQYMPEGGFTKFAECLISHPNITYELELDAKEYLEVDYEHKIIRVKGNNFEGPVVYTGPLDLLFDYSYGKLPYRALEFVWKTVNSSMSPVTPLSAYPEGDKYIRITDYTQFPIQRREDSKSVIALEIPVEYNPTELCGNEPYYPTITDNSTSMYKKYYAMAQDISNLFFGGRLADFKYYNMDACILRALELANIIK